MGWADKMAALDYNDLTIRDEEEEMDEDEDFYGDDSNSATLTDGNETGVPDSSSHARQTPSHSTPAPQPNVMIPQSTIEQAKTENQLRAQQLRAILIAKRQNTPVKPSTNNVPAIPQPSHTNVDFPSNSSMASGQSMTLQPLTKPELVEEEQTSDPIISVEALIAHGKAAADAQVAALAMSSGVGNAARTEAPRAVNEVTVDSVALPTDKAHADLERRPTNLSDPYYADLSAWLDMTNYHDVEFRKTQLRPYLERLALEEEALRIAERIARLDQAQQENAQAFRFGTPRVNGAVPPLPSTLSDTINNLKRRRSPESGTQERTHRVDENGYRIRGAGDSPSDVLPRRERQNSLSPRGHQARGDDRYRPDAMPLRGRDLSLERRQAYYHRRDDDPRADRFGLPPRPNRNHEYRNGAPPPRQSFYRNGSESRNSGHH